jgi:hypothetical protein
MDLELDGSGFGLGSRSQRYAAVIEDGVVSWFVTYLSPALAPDVVDVVLWHLHVSNVTSGIPTLQACPI